MMRDSTILPNITFTIEKELTAARLMALWILVLRTEIAEYKGNNTIRSFVVSGKMFRWKISIIMYLAYKKKEKNGSKGEHWVYKIIKEQQIITKEWRRN